MRMVMPLTALDERENLYIFMVDAHDLVPGETINMDYNGVSTEFVIQEVWEDTLHDMPKDYIFPYGHTRNATFRSDYSSRYGRSLPAETLAYAVILSDINAAYEEEPVMDYQEDLDTPDMPWEE